LHGIRGRLLEGVGGAAPNRVPPRADRILLDGEWTLSDFGELPKTYSQVYAFVYGLEFPDDLEGYEAVLRFESYPWRGGYSAVNFYKQLQSAVPRRDRPRLLSVQYSSPGWIELSLVVGVALSARRIIKACVDSASELNGLYQEIYKNLHERKLLQIEAREAALQLEEKELKFIETSSRRLAKLLKVPAIEVISAQSPNRLAELKMLLSLFRRTRKLAEYEKSGKATF
jgi:hypothetical protein